MSGTLSIIDSLSVGTQLKAYRPSDCNLCQLDQSLEWTSQHLAEWFGQRQPPLDDDKSTSAMLKGDDAWNMGWKPARKVSVGNWQAPWLIRTMNDSFSTICYTAHKSLIANPEFTDTQFDYTAPLDQAKHAELLFGAQGKPLEDITDRLTRQRNNRPMTIPE